MKKTIIKIIYTIVVFIVSLLLIGHFTNVETVDMTARMGAPTFPTVTFESGGKQINMLHGYAQEMDVAHMHGEIMPTDAQRTISFQMNTYGESISDLKFEVRQVSGNSLVENSDITDYSQDGDIIKGKFQMKDLIDPGKEYILVILANVNGKTARYYERVIWTEEDNAYHTREIVDFALNFSNMTFNNAEHSEELAKYLESNADGDNTSFSHVTINSSYEQVTWGGLNIAGRTDPKVFVRDVHPQTSIIVLDYQVTQKIEDGTEKLYNVEEAYRIRYTSDRIYLLNFDRTMNYVFNADTSDITDNVISLWITDPNVTVKESDGGGVFAFVSEDRLYVYNGTGNKIALVFGFYNDEYTDDRATFMGNTIHILSVDEAGNVEFVVSGYMNRGDHEGYVGNAVYKYDSQLNTIEEMAFISSKLHQDIIRSYSEKVLYISTSGALFIKLDGDVYMIDLDSRSQKKLIENLSEDRYCISESGSIIAWHSEDKKTVQIMNLSTQVTSDIEAESGDFVKVLGFMGEDLVYGMAHEYDVHSDRMGSTVYGMHSIHIVDSDGNILENYSPDQGVVTGVRIEDNVIRLSRAQWNEGSQLYDELIDDQIMSTLKKEVGSNFISVAATENYKNITQINVKSNVKKKSLILQTPNMTLFEGSRDVQIDSDRSMDDNPYYFVYGLNGLKSIYDNPAEAVNDAYDAAGVVVNDINQYVWVRGNLLTSNQIMYITNLAETRENMTAENSTSVCLDMILQHRGINVNVDSMLEQGKTVVDILSESLVNAKVLELDGCKMEAMLYYVNQDIPVMATLNDGSSLLIIGFNEMNTVLMEPTTGRVYKFGREDSNNLFENNGNHFVTYLPGVEN
ncbi:hypothetical protein [Butyrivibrio sp. INlla16]|uniref:hypothetical protein n=1 Tax=Butyrivibrio sp. INlla16 TaxID=1520807 RepID=UPI0008844ABB|nr:hypothetical protein [Butyrivibrio sp. INlla16]SDB36142.1 hypothetical protein SAMN02910263_01743 [Butyrivibrio sp. INlla16]